MKKTLFALFATLILTSCGSSPSLDKRNLIPHAVITVNDSLKVTGAIVNESDTTISVAIGSAVIDYKKSAVSIERRKMPSMAMMQKDILLNTESTSEHTGILSGIMVASILSTIVFLLIQK